MSIDSQLAATVSMLTGHVNQKDMRGVAMPFLRRLTATMHDPDDLPTLERTRQMAISICNTLRDAFAVDDKSQELSRKELAILVRALVGIIAEPKRRKRV